MLICQCCWRQNVCRELSLHWPKGMLCLTPQCAICEAVCLRLERLKSMSLMYLGVTDEGTCLGLMLGPKVGCKPMAATASSALEAASTTSGCVTRKLLLQNKIIKMTTNCEYGAEPPRAPAFVISHHLGRLLSVYQHISVYQHSLMSVYQPGQRLPTQSVSTNTI